MRNFPAQYQLQPQDVLNFSHIPKTAGMTFRTIVEDQFNDEETCPATLNAQIKSIPPEAFQRYRLYRGHLAYTNLLDLLPPDKRMINVTVLREPIARVISHYEYIRRMPGDPFYASVKDMTLEEFAFKLPAGNLKKNLQTYYLAKLLRFDLSGLAPSNIFELAKQSLDQCAFVGLVERFQDSLYLLSYIFGWKPIINTRRENAAKVKSSEEISGSTLEAIKENSAYDIELYQYAKQIFEQRFAQMVEDLLEKYLGASESPELPLSSERLAQLLDRHYNQRYAALQIPLTDHAIYDFSQLLRGAGWQRRERSKELNSFRWIGPEPAATLDLPLQDLQTDLVVELCVPHAKLVAPDILQSLAVEVNGQPIVLEMLHTDQGIKFYQGLLPQKVLKSDRVFTEFKFKVNRTASLQDLFPDNPDTRKLGLALSYVQVFPAALKYQKSALASTFASPAWQQVAQFLREQVQPSETIAAPLIFRAVLLGSIINPSALLSGSSAEWVVLHKGNEGGNRLGSLLVKLLRQRYKPVFANEVFIIFTSRSGLPSLGYAAEHVKPLYINYLKGTAVGGLRSLLRKYLSFKTKPQV